MDVSILPKNQPAQQGWAVSRFRVILSRNCPKLWNRIEIFVTAHTKFHQWTPFWSGQLVYISGCHFRRKPQNTLISFGFRVRVWIPGEYDLSTICILHAVTVILASEQRHFVVLVWLWDPSCLWALWRLSGCGMNTAVSNSRLYIDLYPANVENLVSS